MIVTPETNGLNRIEEIAPPMTAITIPLSIDLRHSLHDGFVIYVSHSAFIKESRDTRRVLKAISCAVAEHLKTMPAVEV